MVVFGITGGVGTGKSTVARMLGRRGAAVIDADALAHRAMAPGGAAWRRIVKAFGPQIVGPGRRIDRTRLAAVVFADPAARRRLERIVHPPVLAGVRRELARLRKAGRAKAAVVEIPLLLEVGAQRLVDVVVVVTAPERVQRRRLMQQRGWTREQIRARAEAQWDLAAKVALADAVIDNGNGVETTRTQVNRLWKQRVPDTDRAASKRR